LAIQELDAAIEEVSQFNVGSMVINPLPTYFHRDEDGRKKLMMMHTR